MAAAKWLEPKRASAFSLAAGLVHAVHPIYSEGVAYVWGRSSSLCATFYFAALLLVMKGYEIKGRKGIICYLLAVASGLLAWGTKEDAITLPFAIAGFLFLAGTWRAALIVCVVPLIPSLFWRSDINKLYVEVAGNQRLLATGLEAVLPPFQYFLTHLKAAVFYYLRVFILPFGLNADPYIAPVRDIRDAGFCWLCLSCWRWD